MAGRIKGITVEIGGDTVGLQNALKDVNKRSNDLTKELKDVERLLKFNPGNMEALAQKQQLLTQSIENTTKKLDQLKSAQQQVEAQFARGDIGEEQYRAFRREIEFTEGSLNGLKGKLAGLKAEQDNVASSTRQLGTLFSATGKSVDDFAGALGNRLVNAIKSGTATSRQLDQAIELIGREALGAEADIEKLQRALRSVDDGNSIQNVRNDLRDLSREAERASKSFKELDIGLENMLGGAMAAGGIQGTIEKALDSSKLKTKIDVTFEVPEASKKSVEQAVRGVEAYGVDVEEALEGTRRQWALNQTVSDKANASIVKGAAAITTAYSGIDFTELIQESNEIGNELGVTNESALALTNALLKLGFPPEQLDIIAEYGGQLTRAGYTAEEVQAIMAAGVETGTWNIDNLLDGLKEGRIRAAEFGDEVPKALKDLLEGTKISADQMQKWGKAVAEGGKGGSQAMVEIAKALDGVDDATKKNLIGAQIFGTMYEDQGQNIINTLLGAKDKVVDLNVSQEQLNEMIKKMDANPAVKFQKAMGDLKMALEPLLGVIANIIGAFASWVSAHPALAAALTAIVVAIGILIGACMALAPVFITLSSMAGIVGVSVGAIAGPVALVVGGFIAATAAIAGLVVGFKKLWQTNEGFKNSISSVIGSIQGFINVLISLSKYLFFTAVDGDYLNDWITHLPTGFQNAAELIGKAVSKIRESLVTLFNAVKAVFSGDFSQIGEIFKTIGPSIVGALVGGIPGVLIAASRFLPAIAGQLNENKGVLLEAISNIFSNLANFLTTTLPQFIQTGASIITGIVDGIVQSAPVILQSMVQIINTVSQSIATNLPMLVQSGIQIIQTLIMGITQTLPTIIQIGLQLILTLINSIMLMLPQLIPVAVSIIQTIINGLMMILPQLIEMGINLLISLITGITQALPLIALAIITVITTLINAITQNLPMIITAGIQVLTSLINGIIQMLPQLIDMAINLITQVASTILANLPAIIQAGVQILMALINGIVQILPQLINAALDLIVKIASTLIANLPKILDAGIKILLMLITGIVQVLPQLIAAALKLIVTLVGELIKNLPKLLEAGVKLIGALIKGLLSLLGELGSAALDIGSKILDTLKEVDLLGVGKDIISGLISGIGSMAGAVWDKVKEIGSGIKSGFTDFFDIHSPSRLMRDAVGKQIGAGLAIGMENSIGVINRASQAMTEAAVPSIGGAEPSGSQSNVGASFNFAEMFKGTTFVVREEADIEKITRKISDRILSAGRQV
ncbi:phage tail tape measure protein [Bacillus cereus]|uniref:phage tail tape measure protein n=1 Tax=Bacillus cereus TaxID=1396 RepID=UPI0021AEF6F6|nr:phage tail tape measure protein [Bacillus cereus]